MPNFRIARPSRVLAAVLAPVLLTLAACGVVALAAAAAYASQLPAIRRDIRPVYERLGT